MTHITDVTSVPNASRKFSVYLLNYSQVTFAMTFRNNDIYAPINYDSYCII